ncbi:alpha/beta-Hydrolases superfamily protein [Zea mays]|uniref:Alpha/beta-Hydrolases superfamily protein n=1 Tax=Zea mays TaxID=4577 RepID=A0A1D6IJF2_MAIZE|nr:alpha/beta-Hydrolases superfamily protein [Zea mays]
MPTLGISPLLDAYFRRRFAAAGLVEASVPLDGGATTVHCWRFPPGSADGEDDARPVLVLLHGFGPPATWQWRRQLRPPQGRRRRPALLRRGGAERVEDVMLPRSPERMRRLMQLAYHRPRRFTPGFVLRDLGPGRAAIHETLLLQYLYSDKVEEKKELIKGITLGNKDKFQLTPLPQEVLVLWGEHDQIFPVEKAFQVARKLGANARLEVLKDTGHMPQEEDPKRFNEAILNFLLPAPKSSL